MVVRSSKPNNTGRASGKQSGLAKKVMQMPKGEPFVQLTRELLASPAWRAMSINCRRLIDFLLIEHMNHAGQENGHLLATYDQLVAYGLTRSEILSAIVEAEHLGLIRAEHGGRWAGKNDASIFELTFLYKLSPTPAFATDDWKRTTEEDVSALRQKNRSARQKKKQKAISTSRTTPGLKVELPDAILDGGNQQESLNSGKSRSSESRTPSISTLPSAIDFVWTGALKDLHPKMIIRSGTG
jgi:hypothetical protein